MISLPSLMLQSCAMCGTTLGDGSDPLTRSLSTSVLFMMSMPFLLFVSVAGWFVYRHRLSPEDGAGPTEASIRPIQEDASP